MDALIGVVVGFVLGVARELITWGWRRREAARSHRATVRRAARLVSAELANALRVLEEYEKGGISPADLGFATSDWWDEQRQVLVDGLTADNFSTVDAAYAQLQALNGFTANLSDPNVSAVARHLPEAKAQVIAGRRALEHAAA